MRIAATSTIRHDHAVDYCAVVDRLKHAQRQHAAAAISHLGHLGVGEHAAAPPAHREYEGHQEEGERVDPEPPEREDAGGRDQAGDQERGVRGELCRRHGQPGFPARDGPAGEEVFLEVLGGLPAGAQPRPDGVNDERDDDQQVDHGAFWPPPDQSLARRSIRNSYRFSSGSIIT
jgi:hypothetical protein